MENIKKGDKILKKSDNEDLNNLIRGLLVEEPHNRINWEQYFNHPFFVKKKKNENFKENYEVIKEIGNLPFATVYKAKVIDSGELSAIKVFEKSRLRTYFKRKYLKYPSKEDMKPYTESFLNAINHMQIVDGKNKENNNTVKFYEYYHNQDEIASVMESVKKIC